MDRRDVTRMGTCCYCGSRTLLQLTARDGHELACGSCGAPIHHMKAVRAEQHTPKHNRPHASRAIGYPGHGHSDERPKKKKSKGKKSYKKKSKGIFDMFEDVIDDVFDIFD